MFTKLTAFEVDIAYKRVKDSINEIVFAILEPISGKRKIFNLYSIQIYLLIIL